MKTYCLIVLTFLALASCKTKTNENVQKVSFGIYETIYPSDLPATLSDSLSVMHIRTATEAEEPIIGYIKSDSLAFLNDFMSNTCKLLNTAYTVDSDSIYHAVVAVKPVAVMSLSTIKKTKADGNGVVLVFNMEGANLFAKITRHNAGKAIAFVVENQVYSLPVVNAEIRDGRALIGNLESETLATALSESINASLPK
ncbi:MAG: hypothetical protein JXQ80_11655 [Bacteroidales bacterium]|nr:hypothetical protein [Bacteroidales bacterium]